MTCPKSSLSIVVSTLLALTLGCRSDRRMVDVDGGRGMRDADSGGAADSSTPPPRTDGGTDPGCAVGPEDDWASCTDGCSNDGDPHVDCEDRDCCDVVACPAGTYCGGSPDAGAPPSCMAGSENSVALCSDGCSNDGDPFVDCEDYDCCDVVACPPSSACGSRATSTAFVSRSASDCVGTGTVSYTFGSEVYEMATVAFATSTGYQVFGYTRGAITSGPFPLTGMPDERQARIADLGSGLTMALSRWGGSSWTSSEGGAATFSDASIVSLASDVDDLYPTYACVGHVRGSATAPVYGGVDFMLFEFDAPVLGLGFPGVR